MGTKLNRTLIVLLVLQVAAVVALRMGKSSEGPARPHKVLPSLDAKAVRGIEIVDGDGKSARLARRGGSWVLASGGDYPVKADKVDAVLGKLVALTAGPPVADKATQHRALEVASDKFQRKITLTLEGDKTLGLLLGSTPGFKRVHLRRVSEDAVYAAGELSAWDADTGASAWVDPEYFKVERDQIVSLTLKNAKGEIALTKGTDGKWALAGLEPGKQLDQGEVDALLSSASAISLQSPVGKKIEPAYGLDQPLVELTVVVAKPAERAEAKAADAGAPAAAARTTRTLRIGKQKGDEYYAKASGSDFVVLVGKWAVEALVDKQGTGLIEKPDKKDGAEMGGEDPAPGLGGHS